MNGLNRFYLIGNLGEDPRKIITGSGNSLVKVSIATPNRVKQGEVWVDMPDWNRLTCWGQNADFLAQYGRKGDTCSVEGRIKNSKYTVPGRDGQPETTRYETVLLVDRILSLDSKTARRQATQETRPASQDMTEIQMDETPPELDMP